MMCCAGGAVRGCSCLNCTNNVECTIISIGAVETTAPPKNAQLYQLVQLRQLHPLRMHNYTNWCSSCSGKRQSRAETTAPPKQVFPF